MFKTVSHYNEKISASSNTEVFKKTVSHNGLQFLPAIKGRQMIVSRYNEKISASFKTEVYKLLVTMDSSFYRRFYRKSFKTKIT